MIDISISLFLLYILSHLKNKIIKKRLLEGLATYLLLMNILIWSLWLLVVICWNFGYSDANPFEDVVAVVLLSLLSIALNEISSITNLHKSIGSIIREFKK